MLPKVNYLFENSKDIYMFIYKDSVDVFVSMYFSLDSAEKFVYDNKEVIYSWQQKLNSEESKLKRKKIVAPASYKKLSSEFENVIFGNGISSDSNDSHKISMMQIIDLYCNDESFRDKMQSGKFIYLDNYVCINEEQYIERKNGKITLSDYGVRHKNECCLYFAKTAKEKSIIYSLPDGYIDSDVEETIIETKADKEVSTSLSEYLRSIKNKKDAEHKEVEAECGEYAGMCWEEGFSESDIAYRSFLSRETVSRILNDDTDRRCELETLLGLACGLKLKVPQVNNVVRLGGYTIRRYNVKELVYEACFMFCENTGIDQINATLLANGCGLWGVKVHFEKFVKKDLGIK